MSLTGNNYIDDKGCKKTNLSVIKKFEKLYLCKDNNFITDNMSGNC